jgi:hypothetical protein
MAKTKAKPGEIARLGQAALSASEILGDGQREAAATLAVPASAFGTLAGELPQSHSDLLDGAGETAGALVELYESDTGSLYTTAADYQHTDEENARKLHKTTH